MEYLDSGFCSVFGRCLLTPCLQPQMKTYRCPWCVSRTNHNILYFVNISCTSSLNPGLCLWKPRISLAGRGFERSDLHQIWGVARAHPGPQSNRSTRASTLAPPRLQHKAQNRCTSPALLFKLWTIGLDGPLLPHDSKRDLIGSIRW